MELLKKIVIVTVLVSLCLLNFVQATDFTSSNFIIKDPVITPGAGFSTSTNFQLWSSLGQAAIGTSTAASFILKAGFLYFPAAIVISPALPPAVQPTIVIGVGAPPAPPAVPKEIIRRCDFNNDNRCNIIDFSILLYYFDKPIAIAERYDLNYDRKINLIDASILFYYWTF